jgi:D-psicose/D-tagatose/L-ribulose 3-epimerase
MTRLALCNEVVRDLSFERQCEMAAALGYAGLEIAPFTLGEEAFHLPASQRATMRQACANTGIAVSGLHWLLVSPAGLSITSGDKAVWTKTVDIMRRLIDFCADLGGTYLVHGSPNQRRLAGEPDPAAAAKRGEAAFAAVAEAAAKAHVTYCIEPLASAQTDFITTVAQAAVIVRSIGNPAIKTMLDTCAAGRGERAPVAAVLRQWLPTGLIAHVHLNDRNRRAPGQGTDRFGPILQTLFDCNYAGWIGIEPFEYVPDGPGSAARAIGYISGLMESIANGQSP